MRKIYIVGMVASGKTTFARTLSKEMGIPFYELDCIVCVKTSEGQYKRTPEEQFAELQRIDNLGDWIIEGTYRESCKCLLQMSDRIIFLDPPLWRRKHRILKRFIKQKLRIESCHYKSDISMLKMMYKWTNDFEKNRIQFESMLEKYEHKLAKIDI